MRQQISETDYRSLFDNMLDGLAYCHMIFDSEKHPVDFVFLEVNKNYEKLSGMKDVIGKKVTDLIPGIKESSPEMFESYGRVALTGRPEKIEIYVKPLSRWFLISVYSPRKEYFIATFQNITKQKQTEKDLENAKIAARNVLEDLQVEKETIAHEKAKDEAMLASIGDGVIIVDPTGKITLMNKSAQNLLGWQNAEILGKLLFDVVPIEDEKGELISAKARPMTIALVTGAPTNITEAGKEYIASDDKTRSGIYYYIRKDKTKFPVAITVAPVMLESKIVGAIEVFRDITKEKDIDRAKSEFVSLASHQLRTPLGISKWYIETLIGEGYLNKAPKIAKRYLDEVYKSNERLLALVRDLLSISRIDQGKVGDKPQLTNITQLVKDVIKAMNILASKNKITIKLDLKKPEIPALFIDHLRAQEVIENLITNAIEYSNAHGIVEVILDERDGNVLIGVKDKGIGVSENDKKKLFTKFFRSEKAVEKNTEGSGLGLYVVKSYVEGWGGNISLDSLEGKGSNFTISLPLKVRSEKRSN